MTNNVKDNWYEDFFQGINCELWEKAVSPEWTKQEVNFLMEELNIGPGQPLLDIPCGFGRHSIEFAKRGIFVTGVDISKTFTSRLTQKVRDEKLSVKPVLADVLKMNLQQKFSGAVCMGNSFGYFSFDKMELFVKKISDCLDIGARFIINSGMIAESILPNFAKNKSFTIEDIKMDIINTYCIDDSFMISDILYTKGDKTEKHAFKHYVFTLSEVKRLLKKYGLEVIATYNSPVKTKFQLGDQQIYIVAEKN
jgi:cyclopropane fatty-acyl-phospholipid synthase-like methyltransferase